jgi:predicted ATPase/class 3 adenylate cyclase/DNA-binding CsgD family transcriptional regulator
MEPTALGARRHALVQDDEVSGAVDLPTGTVTLLMTDVEGSTAHWQRDGERAAQALARHLELLDAAISLHSGVRPVEQGEGDSVVAAFARPSDAVAAALDIQRAFADEPWPTTNPIRVRLAVHTGEAWLRGIDNYQGPAIIRCARIRNAGHGGQVLLSNSTQELVTDHLPDTASLRSLGTHQLKGLDRPEQVWQLRHPELVDEFPPLQSLEAGDDRPPGNLPAPLTALIGRDEELAEVGRIVAGSRLVTLAGAGGCGKSRLAVQVAADARHDHPNGVWWVELAPVRDDRFVVAALMGALGFHEDHDDPPIETVCGELRKGRHLVVLDNCEHVVDGVSTMVATLLDAVPELRVLTTSREPLGLVGEVAWRVPSLGPEGALALFVDRAAQARPGFTEDSDRAVGQICERLDGLPLAIELAAARLRAMSLADIAAGLDDRFRLLTGGGRGAVPRQRTLEASVAWSHDLLDDSQRAVLRRLSTFGGGFRLDAAEPVVADDVSVAGHDVLDLVTALVDRSLLQFDDEPSGGRYRLLETIRHFATDRLVESGDAAQTRDRHLAHYLAIAERAEPDLAGPDVLARLSELDLEQDNLRAALGWAESSGDTDSFLRLATALTLYWEMRGHLREGAQWFVRALEQAGDERSVAHARALWGSAHTAVYSDAFAEARDRAAQAVAMAEAVGDDRAKARSLNAMGFANVWFDPGTALDCFEESIRLGRATHDDWAAADGLKMLSTASLVDGDLVRLRRVVDELEVAATELGSRFFQAWCDATRGYADLREGDAIRARFNLEQAIEGCREVGDPATGGLAVAWLAELDLATGHTADGRRRLEAFIATASATGGHLAMPPAILTLTAILLADGEVDGAQQFATGLSSSFTVPWLQGWTRALLGAAEQARGDQIAACAALVEAGPPCRASGNPWLVAMIDRSLGRVARAEGDLSAADEQAHRALATSAAAHRRGDVLDALEDVASAAGDLESHAEAIRLFAGVESARPELGLVRWSVDQAGFDADVARSRSALGDEAFEAAWSEGHGTPLDELVAYAQRARGERRRPSIGWAGLTPTEERVVALVAEGLTNPEIGERLFIARGTVKAHLSHIFAKLGVRTRAELAAAATRRAVAAETPEEHA